MKKYLAFDIGGTNIKYGIINSSGNVIERAETPSNIHLGGDVLMNKLLELTTNVFIKHKVLGVGICTPGVVDAFASKIVAGANHIKGWCEIEQCKVINERFKVPCCIQNDGKSAAIGEKWRGAGKPYSCFYMITYGTGLGGSLVINGKIHHGHSNVAGEVSSLYSAYLDSDRYAATSSLVNIAKTRFNNIQLDGREIFSQIRAGNQEYTDLLDEWCEFASIPLCDIYSIVDPDALVIGGGISNNPEIFLPRLEKSMSKRLRVELPNLKINLVPAKLGNDAGMIGSIYSLRKK